MVRKLSLKAWVSACILLLASAPAIAAGLGKLTVTSSLGQPFRGEIELLAMDKKDLGSISAGFASFDTFKEAKIERLPVFSAMRFSVEQKKNGAPYLKITSTKPIDEPFLDMLIEIDWPSGRLVREYTVLLDPPGYGEPQGAVAPVAPPLAKAAPAPEAVKPEIGANIPLDKKLPGKAPAKEEGAEAKAAHETYGPVKKGENLAGIAATLKPEGISLEQMLVGLFQSNRQAFYGNNMNRLKAGQILRVPGPGQAAAVEKGDAVKEVKAQAADWNAYRQKLAAAVAEARPAKEEAARQAASGKITAAVEDKAAAAREPAKDVLRLSRSEGLGVKPGVVVAEAGSGKELQAMKDQIHAMQEEATAREKSIKEANQRIADLEKNIKEMQQLLELKNQSLADLQKQAEPAKTAPAADQAAKPAEKPVAQPKKPMPVIPQPKPPEPSLLDELMGSPLYLGGGAVAILLLGLLGVRMAAARRRAKVASFEDSIMTSGDLKANTVLGATGGGKIDTTDTSFLTDFSQAGLGAIDTNEVDPIAEAEVYMAYGRDAQAEEILKEALAKDPNRHEIRLKLLEIYAGRKNVNAFEAVAGGMYAMLGGQASPIWDKAAEMGRALDPNNPLYGEKPVVAAEHGVTGGTGTSEGVAPDLDLNLDIAVPEAKAKPDVPLEAAPAEESKPAEEASADLGFDFDLAALAGTGAQAEPQKVEEKAESSAGVGLDFNLDKGPGTVPEPETMAESGVTQESALEFDLGALIQAAPEADEAVKGEESGMEPAPAEGLASDDSWKDEVMSLGFDTGGPSAPAETPAQAVTEQGTAGGMDEIAEAGGVGETTVSDLAGISESEEIPSAREEMESIELAAPPVEESPLDFDFSLEEEEEAPALAEMKELSVPELDLSGISLEMDEPAEAQTAPAVQPAEGFGDQEVTTKLDLARAYMDMGDKEGAREILQEVLKEGTTVQQEEARKLLSDLD